MVPSAPHPRELPLELNSAIENLERLESEVTGAINKLLSYAGPSWREKDKLQPKLMDIKLAVLRLRSALHDLSEFSEGVLGNALNAPDKGEYSSKYLIYLEGEGVILKVYEVLLNSE